MLYKNVNKSKISSNISSIGIVFKRYAPIVFGFSIITYAINLYKEILKSCKVLKIYTGKIDVSGQKITKNYTGDMIISVSFSSCYCSLINSEIGELCFLFFHHMFLFSQEIICRVGGVLTTSSGSNRRPTMHRMVISKYPFDISKEVNGE